MKKLLIISLILLLAISINTRKVRKPTRSDTGFHGTASNKSGKNNNSSMYYGSTTTTASPH